MVPTRAVSTSTTGPLVVPCAEAVVGADAVGDWDAALEAGALEPSGGAVFEQLASVARKPTATTAAGARGRVVGNDRRNKHQPIPPDRHSL